MLQGVEACYVPTVVTDTQNKYPVSSLYLYLFLYLYLYLQLCVCVYLFRLLFVVLGKPSAPENSSAIY